MRLACEVLVVGGGTAGVPAAVAAARAGATTVLLERHAVLGGTPVRALHRHVCGLYRNGPALADELLNAGLVREICDGLRERAPRSQAVRLGRVDVLPFAGPHLQAVFTALAAREPRLQVLGRTPFAGLRVEGDRIVAVSAAGGVEVAPQVVIDGSGDGAVLMASGCQDEAGPDTEPQLAGFTVRLKGLRGVEATTAIQVPYCLREGVQARALPDYARFTTFAPGDAPDEGFCKLSLPAAARRGAMDGRGEAERVCRLLSERLAAFRDAWIAETAAAIAEREGPRLQGEYTLTADDVLGARAFPDAAARNAWPIEIWDAQRGPTFRYLNAGAAYDIPLRCLRARRVRNLLCAGRCLSATREALGSARVMGPCMALGEAAGREAARLCGR